MAWLHDEVESIRALAQRHLRFPARLDWLASPRAWGRLPEDIARACAWRDAEPGLILGAACGLALGNRLAGRAGRIVVVLAGADLAEPAVATAAAFAASLDLRGITVLMADGDGGTAAADLGSAGGWEVIAPAAGANTPATMGDAAAHDLPGQPCDMPCRLRREWQPVHLPLLPMGGGQPWPPPREEEDAHGFIGRALAWLAQGDGRVVAVQEGGVHQALHDACSRAPAIGAAALAELAADGRRVCWRLPAGTALAALDPARREIGRRQLALKLVCALDDWPDGADWDGWWIAAAAEPGEAGALVAWTLADEFPCLIAASTASADGLPAMDAAAAHEPGAGRWLARGARGTLVADARSLAMAWRARLALADEGIDVGVLHASSLSPLPERDLRQAAVDGPVAICAAPATAAALAVLIAAPVVDPGDIAALRAHVAGGR